MDQAWEEVIDPDFPLWHQGLILDSVLRRVEEEAGLLPSAAGADDMLNIKESRLKLRTTLAVVMPLDLSTKIKDTPPDAMSALNRCPQLSAFLGLTKAAQDHASFAQEAFSQ